MFAYHRVKRSLDFLGSFLALFCLTPLFLILAILVKLDGGPVFFRHRRVGYKGKEFDCLKFRTMKVNNSHILAEYLVLHPEAAQEWKQTRKLKKDPRVTRVGRILRPLSLDELPQLVNVLLGHMAIVGPRPVTQEELNEHYVLFEDCYKSVRPGITGVWQISGRSNLSYSSRVMMDVNYAQRHTLARDLCILIRTPAAVLTRRGAY